MYRRHPVPCRNIKLLSVFTDARPENLPRRRFKLRSNWTNFDFDRLQNRTGNWTWTWSDVTFCTILLVYMEDEFSDGGGDKLPHITLRELLLSVNLLSYEAALLQHGADDVEQLKYLEDDLFESLCEIVGLKSKPLHLLRFRKALGRDTSHISFISKADDVPRNRSLEEKTRSQISANPPGFLEQNVPQCMVNSSVSASPASSLTIHAPPGVNSSANSQTLVLSTNVLNYTSVHGMSSSSHENTSGMVTNGNNGNFVESQSLQSFSILPHNSLQPQINSPNVNEASCDESYDVSFCLPAYLHPKSNTSDFSQLVDEATPVQQSLGLSPISPMIWDQKRAELIRTAAAIYGKKTNSRKTGELTSHEANVNEASAQLCLRDPTLLVRREELFILSRRAVREGGFSYVHGFSRSKHVSGSRSVGGSETEEGIPESIVPKSVRERRKQRLEELERLISRNKEEQETKMSALDQAQEMRDFSQAFQLQTEIEALGNVCLTLETEYNQLKRRQKRSDRYFENKAKRPATEDSQPKDSASYDKKMIILTPPSHPTISLPVSQLPSAIIPTHDGEINLQDTQIFQDNHSSVNTLVSLVTEVSESTSELVDKFLTVSSTSSEN